MTDSAGLIPNSVGVSSDAMYNLKASSVRCRSYRSSVPSSNKQVFNPQDTAILYCSGGRRNTYLDCANTYLRYTIKNNDTTGTPLDLYLDNNGACVINRIDIYHGSNLLESVQQYNMLMTHYLDFNYNTSQKAGLSSMYGLASDGSRQGAKLLGGTKQSITVCMPILSCTIGLGADKYLPVGRLSDDIRIEITFESGPLAVFSTAALLTTWSITNLELEATYIELSDEGEMMVREASPINQPLYLHGTSWRHYSSTLNASSSAYSALVPARFASLKNMIIHTRQSATLSSSSFSTYCLSSRSNPQITSWWLRLGSALIPAKFVVLENSNTTGGYAEAAIMIQQTFHALASPGNAPGLSTNVFNVRDASDLSGTTVITAKATGDSYLNGFALAIELEGFANRQELLVCGINTLSQQVYFEFNSAGSNLAQIIDYWAVFDAILVLDGNGLLSVRM